MLSKVYTQLRINLRVLLTLTPFMLASIVLVFIMLANTSPATASGMWQSSLPSPGISPASPPPEQPAPPTPAAPTGPALAPTAVPGASAPAGGSSTLIVWIAIGLVIGVGIVVGTLALQRRPK
jgi:hypothetical protein